MALPVGCFKCMEDLLPLTFQCRRRRGEIQRLIQCNLLKSQKIDTGYAYMFQATSEPLVVASILYLFYGFSINFIGIDAGFLFFFCTQVVCGLPFHNSELFALER